MFRASRITADSAAGADEQTRSAALHAYDILDTPREADFDDLAKLASEICQTPIAVVNLVDTRRQFFKAEVGLGVRETPLETSFCGHAILSEDMMVVPDATKDPRFDGNPLVVGEPRLRFYAGALLKTPGGHAIGTVCVLDYQPRDLDERQIRSLKVLARQAMTQIELRRVVAEQHRALDAARAAERDKTILARIAEQSSDFIGMADTEGRAFFLNEAAQRMVGLAGADITKTSAIDYFVEEDRETVIQEVMPAVAAKGIWEGELRFRNFETGATIPVLYNIFPLRDTDGLLVGYGTVAKDITAQKAEQARRADITREMSHRMKNTLAMVQAIVTQTFRRTTSIPEGLEAISARLGALGRAQEILTETEGGDVPIRDMVETALAPHRTGQGRFAISGPSLVLTGPQALGLSLAIHELATNAAKHGALSNVEGRVRVDWMVDEGRSFEFLWAERDGPAVGEPTRRGFGMRLMEKMVAPYFGGQARLHFDPGGVRFRLVGTIE